MGTSKSPFRKFRHLNVILKSDLKERKSEECSLESVIIQSAQHTN